MAACAAMTMAGGMQTLDRTKPELPQPEQMPTRLEADRLFLATLDRLAATPPGATT